MISIDLTQLWVVMLCTVWKQFRVIVVWSRGSLCPVYQSLRNHVDVIERDFAFSAQPETDDTFHFCMDSLVETYNDVVA